MPNNRFFIEESLETSKELALQGEEHHHLVNVMRVKLHEEIEIVNGKGILAKAQVYFIEKKESKLLILSHYQEKPALQKHTLVIGLPRFNRLEYIIEKAVELGIDSFILFPADLSEKKELSANQWERIKHLGISALKQCGRLFLPNFSFLSELNAFRPENERLFFGDTKEKKPFCSFIRENASCTFFIGPEQGFSKEETLFLCSNLNAQGVCLNQNILRVDTAAITAAAFLSDLKLPR